MVLMVDEAIWPWRDRRWAHLASDQSRDELHDFAQALGLRRVGFQGDHYDVDEVDRERALDAGAGFVPAREIVRRLVASGLRDRGPKPGWVGVAESRPGHPIDGVASAIAAVTVLDQPRRAGLLDWLGQAGSVAVDGWVRALRRPDQFALMIDHSAETLNFGPAPIGAELVSGGPRLDGERSVELFFRLSTTGC